MIIYFIFNTVEPLLTKASNYKIYKLQSLFIEMFLIERPKIENLKKRCWQLGLKLFTGTFIHHVFIRSLVFIYNFL